MIYFEIFIFLSIIIGLLVTIYMTVSSVKSGEDVLLSDFILVLLVLCTPVLNLLLLISFLLENDVVLFKGRIK